MDWIKRWHTVKFIVLVYDGSRGVGAWVWINTLTLTLSLSVFYYSVTLSQYRRLYQE